MEYADNGDDDDAAFYVEEYDDDEDDDEIDIYADDSDDDQVSEIPPPPSKEHARFWKTAHFFNVPNMEQDAQRILGTFDTFYRKWGTLETLPADFQSYSVKLREWIALFPTQMRNRRVVSAQLCYLDEGFNLLDLFLESTNKLIKRELRWSNACRHARALVASNVVEGGQPAVAEDPNAYRACTRENIRMSNELAWDVYRVVFQLLGCDLKGVHLFLNYMRWFRVSVPSHILREVRWKPVQDLYILEDRCRFLTETFAQNQKSLEITA
ncbi:unnamed protein product [marine sediment metagenome]|uniref:Uncharacterized protein n=1 Tax=marine sediment metagenome TaxID=412755 RepID=X1ABJ7_9ZZZZ